MKGGILRGGVMVLVGCWTTSRAASRFRSDVASKAQAQLRTRVNVYSSLASMVRSTRRSNVTEGCLSHRNDGYGAQRSIRAGLTRDARLRAKYGRCGDSTRPDTIMISAIL
ncbi:hypothetical protein BKA56DRAFT_33284 [Ilyonectria sp. MPI-CAGE-AT-0026]|nr:hypothetical protein BKA56DRAFT_33284 [Ilyonectria sp. MPI-CAGE-AT-0026]